MGWHLVAGIVQLVLTAYFLVTHWTALRGSWRTGPEATNALIYLVPMIFLAVGTLVGAAWAIVVAAVFYSVWLINHLFSWWVPYLTGWPHGVAREQRRTTGRAILPARRGRPNPDLGHLVLGGLLVLVVLATWYAVANANL